MMQNPRVTSGVYKNRKLQVPDKTRPATERFKLAFFDTIQEVISESRFADIFAGAGSIGIEALSRGAAYVAFNDLSNKAVDTIRKNCEEIHIPIDQYEIQRKNYTSFVNQNQESFDIVFADPPFVRITDFNLGALLYAVRQEGILCLKLPTKNLSIERLLEPLKELIILDKKIGKNRLVVCRRGR